MSRQRLPQTRKAVTHRFDVGEQHGYFTVGLFDDGKPAELFVHLDKEGSTIGGLLEDIGILTSVALQHGVELETLVDKFAFQIFPPNGMTRNPEIPFAHSVPDYIFRWMGRAYIDGYKAKQDVAKLNHA